MKFIARKGAPDIPLELIEAQENDDLVFFCGAGVSYPAGLPDFAGLVEDVYDLIPEMKSDLEEQAIKTGFFDRALGLLENRLLDDRSTSINIVRQKIIEKLTITAGANLETHRALLDLSRTKSGRYRLVTTNVDHAFINAKSDIVRFSDAAPKLPVPKPYKWASIVHLHGIIDVEKDPNGDHLVFTSGDFGAAYLTERWASKFVTELFSNFKVVFIGYSINDPVIRYMTDAISAEIKQGDQHFKKPFLIAEATPKKREQAIREWRAKGVEPVLYSKGNKYHSNLHKSLIAWANHAKDGVTSKQRIIRTKARIAPIPPYEQDESIQQVIDTLKEKRHGGAIDGTPAKEFFKLNNPPAPIEWLPILEDEGLLSLGELIDTVYAVDFNRDSRNVISPNNISHFLWRWLIKHLENRKLIKWVVERGGCLHPDFKSLIKYEISDNNYSDEVSLFWKLVTCGYLPCRGDMRVEGYKYIKLLTPDSDPIDISLFVRNMLEPHVILSKTYSYYNEDSRLPYRAEVSIHLDEYFDRTLRDKDSFPNNYTFLLEYVNQALKSAMQLWELIGDADEKNDKSHWDIVSIQPHEQNKHFRRWAFLIGLCRDLWLSLYEQDKLAANRYIDIWKSYKYPVFRRLVLHVYTVTEVVSPVVALRYMLEDDKYWLWSVVTFRENYRLLSKIWSSLSYKSTNTLVAAIESGPPRFLYRDGLEEEKYKFRVDRERWLYLAKLETFGKPLNQAGQELLNSLTKKYPKWQLQEGERDEFTHWSGSGRGHKTDITLDGLFELTEQQITSKLREQNNQFFKGRINSFRNGAKDYREKTISILKNLGNKDGIDGQIWHAGLVGLADSDKPSWLELSENVSNLPLHIYEKESWAISWWARKAISSVETKDDTEIYLWEIVRKLLAIEQEIELKDDDSVINKAINNSLGIITEAVIDRFGKRKIGAGERLPKDEITEILNALFKAEGSAGILIRVILFSRLAYFFAIDKEWTLKNFIPRLNFNESDESIYAWRGYLWSLRIPVDLAIEIHEFLLQALERSDEFGDDLKELVQLFVFCCINYPDLYPTQKTIFTALSNSGSKGLGYAANFLSSNFAVDDVDKDSFWENRAKRILQNWPKGGRFVSESISENLTILALKQDAAFPAAVKIVLPLIAQVKHMRHVLNAFDGNTNIKNYTSESLLLLDKIFSTDNIFDIDLVRRVADQFIAAAPEVNEDPRFTRISDFLAKNNG